MLIQFTVTNYRSFRDSQTLSMIASKALKRKRAENTFASDTQEKGLPDLLRCAAVFGPNAAGKSNLIRALQFVERTVMMSAHADSEEPIDVQPFRLNAETLAQDSTFEVEFIESGTRYQFGFAVNRERISSEWLISYPRARPQELYRRRYDKESQRDEYEYGNQLEGGRLRKDWAAQTGPKTLYISRVVQASSAEFQQLRLPFKWFSRRLRILLSKSGIFNGQSSSKLCEDEAGRAKVLSFLSSFDIPIAEIEVNREPLDMEKFHKLLSKEAIDTLLIGKTFEDNREPIFFHKTEQGDLVKFTPAEESSGTMSLFGFASRWIEAIENDLILVIDELDSSLHPLVVWELIRKLSESGSKAQLIFTTHDATVMKSKLLRRDQVYFVSADKTRSSSLYSLFDFKGREDDPIEDRYLQGRYGATPILTR